MIDMLKCEIDPMVFISRQIASRIHAIELGCAICYQPDEETLKLIGLNRRETYRIYAHVQELREDIVYLRACGNLYWTIGKPYAKNPGQFLIDCHRMERSHETYLAVAEACKLSVQVSVSPRLRGESSEVAA